MRVTECNGDQVAPFTREHVRCVRVPVSVSHRQRFSIWGISVDPRPHDPNRGARMATSQNTGLVLCTIPLETRQEITSLLLEVKGHPVETHHFRTH